MGQKAYFQVRTVSFREGIEYFQQKHNGSSEVLAKKQLLKEWLRVGLTTKKVFYDHCLQMGWNHQLSNEEKPLVVEDIGGYILPRYVGAYNK